jgi:uncharacterized protein (DUF488 family)
MLATIGYEHSSPVEFIATLKDGKIDVLVDVRERAQSRKAGFSKSALARAVEDVGIKYIHFRELGDPKPGREAARAGMIDEFRRIYAQVLNSEQAKRALHEISRFVNSSNVCLMCFEADYRNCHRKLISDQIELMIACDTRHLEVKRRAAAGSVKGRMLHPRQGAAA